MSLANDKGSSGILYSGPNASLIDRVKTSGFMNVIANFALAFQSGNKSTSVVFVGEEAPGSNYDSDAKNGDMYIRATYSGGVVSTLALYVRSGSAWKQIMLGDSDGLISLAQLDSGIAPTYINVGVGTVTSDAGTSGSIAITGLLTTDTVVGQLTSGWTPHTGAGASISGLTIHTAGGSVLYEISGTSNAGTSGGLAVTAYREAS